MTARVYRNGRWVEVSGSARWKSKHYAHCGRLIQLAEAGRVDPFVEALRKALKDLKDFKPEEKK